MPVLQPQHTTPEEPSKLVMLVDDDLVLLDSIADILTINGYKLFVASNGVEALELLKEHRPDVIVSDIMMPVMDGYELYRAVHSQFDLRDIPFLFLTAKGQDHDRRMAYAMGIDMYVTKPFEPEDLVVAIENRITRMAEIRAITDRELDKAKQHLLDVFGHELRTPLSIIYGYSNLLESGIDMMGPEMIQTIMIDMRRGTERITRLIEDLMLYNSISQGLIEAEIEHFKEQVALGAKVETAIYDIRPLAEANNVTISATVPRNTITFGQPRLIKDIFQRVLSNAVKFTPSGGKITIWSEIENGMCYVHVQDTGIGIEPENLDKVFEYLVQINREEREQQGTGIGLTIARNLARMHSGDITVTSTPHEGSTFTISLPCLIEAEE